VKSFDETVTNEIFGELDEELISSNQGEASLGPVGLGETRHGKTWVASARQFPFRRDSR
jgi:hypothetical protein